MKARKRHDMAVEAEGQVQSAFERLHEAARRNKAASSAPSARRKVLRAMNARHDDDTLEITEDLIVDE